MKDFSSIVEHIAYKASIDPDKPALADSRHLLTYGQLWSEIYGLSRELSRIGIKSGDGVAVACSQNTDYMVCEFAIQLLKAIFIPLEKNSAKDRANEIINESGAALYIGRSPVDGTSFVDIRQISDFSFSYKDIPPFNDLSFPGREDIAEILFSTGTTGKSKGIVLTHGNDIALAENVMYGVRMKKDNIELIPMPLSHSHGLRRTYANLLNGSTAVFSDGVTLLKQVFNLMDIYKVTSMDLSPSMLSIIFKLSGDRLGQYADQIDYIQLGSAPLSEEDKNHLVRLLPSTRLYNFYGSTESGCACLLDFNTSDVRPHCIGRPAKNAKFKIVDNEKNTISSSAESPGFLASFGSMNMKCYFNAPDLTRSVLKDGWLYTSDLGYIDDDGFVYMLGRKDDVINYGGVKIAPEEVESIVMRNQQILDCACIPVEDTLTGQAPKLFIVPKDPSCYDAKEFRRFLSTALDQGKQPKYIEIIDEIPRTYNGKIQRNKLMESENLKSKNHH